MLRFILKRVFWALFVVFVVISGVFFAVRGIGDPARARFGPQAQQSVLDAYRKQHGLDRPIVEQYLSYIGGVVQGDFGRARQNDQPVVDVIGARLPRTLLLGAMAMFFELLIGLSVGIIAASFRNSYLDTSLMALSFVGISAPTFLTGLLFLNWWAFRLGWFPVGGYGLGLWSSIYHTILPAFTLAIFGAATYALLIRSELIEKLFSDYVRTARAKGLSPVRVILAHGVRNALLPVVTLMGLQLRTLVSGAIITEAIFAYPGIGRLAWESLNTWDDMMILSVTTISCAAVLIGNTLADIAVAGLDPRVRLGHS
ncbi:MAG: ABC transporter permease [Myxococcales bacterium]|nr:MAG: ABC transporter permease [Myxococcales bacterium]